MEVFSRIKRFDNLSPEIKLKYKKEFQNMKSTFGGFITILSYILFLAAIIYFSIRFLSRANFNINQSTKISSSNNITDYNTVPFMLTTNVNPNNLTDQLTYLQFTMKVRQVIQKVSIEEISIIYEFEQCDINNPKHVSPLYKNTIIESGYDISTYLCINWKNDTVNLIGTYGQNQNITSISITVLACDNSTSSVTCKTPEQIFKAMKRVNLSILTVSNDINHDREIPEKPSIAAQKIRSNGFMETDIYIFYNKVEYQSDNGFLLKDERLDSFFQFSGITTEIGDFNDSMKFSKSFTFFRLYVSVAREMLVYHRNYEKVQVVLALLGGIINGILILAKIVNYNIGQRVLYIEIYNSIPELHIEAIDNSLSKHKEINKSVDSVVNNYVSNQISTLKTQKTIIIKKFQLSWLKLALPTVFWTSEERKKYQKIQETVDNSLCLTEIIKDISLTKNLVADLVQPEKYKEAIKIFKNCQIKVEPVITNSILNSSQQNFNTKKEN